MFAKINQNIKDLYLIDATCTHMSKCSYKTMLGEVSIQGNSYLHTNVLRNCYQSLFSPVLQNTFQTPRFQTLIHKLQPEGGIDSTKSRTYKTRGKWFINKGTRKRTCWRHLLRSSTPPKEDGVGGDLLGVRTLISFALWLAFSQETGRTRPWLIL